MKIVSVFSVSFLLSFLLVAEDIPMSLSMQGILIKKDNVKKVELNDSCKIIPPMLVHLLLMLEKDLNKCNKSLLHMPSISVAEKKLCDMLKKGVKVSKVSVVKGFSIFYKIESYAGFYSNRHFYLLKRLRIKICN